MGPRYVLFQCPLRETSYRVLIPATSEMLETKDGRAILRRMALAQFLRADCQELLAREAVKTFTETDKNGRPLA